MNRGRKFLLAGAAVVAIGAGGVGIAQAVDGDSEEEVTGPEADRAKQAAIEVVGGGQVEGVERSDDGGAAWEVEVAQDGREIEVHLNRGFERVRVSTEGGDANERDDSDERGDDD